MDSSVIAISVYDADGRRIQKTTGGVTVSYLYDIAGHQIAEISSSGAWNRGEIYAGARHLGTYNNGTTFFNHEDWLGTERARSNVTGVVCETIASLPYGDGQNTAGTCGDESPMHFTGKMRDTESNLDDFDARYYSSQWGRFTIPDWDGKPVDVPYAKFGDPQSLNLYGYVRNNPSTSLDPDGHCCLSELINFGVGLLNAYASDNFAGAGRQQQTTTAGRAGAAVGDTIAAIEGTGKAFEGTAATVALAPADATPAAAVAVPVQAATAAVAAQGAVEGTTAAVHLFKSAFGPKEGESGGPGAGKKIDDKTKGQALNENKEANGGQAKCVFCGESVGEGTNNKINYDHAQAKANGGNNSLNNTNVTCEYCNKSKGTGSEPKNPKNPNSN